MDAYYLLKLYPQTIFVLEIRLNRILKEVEEMGVLPFKKNDII